MDRNEKTAVRRREEITTRRDAQRMSTPCDLRFEIDRGVWVFPWRALFSPSSWREAFPRGVMCFGICERRRYGASSRRVECPSSRSQI